MKRHLKKRFWLKSVIALGNAGLLLVTVFWPDWMELAFHLDPDAGSGAIEWAIVSVTLASTIVFSMLARSEWRRASMQVA